MFSFLMFINVYRQKINNCLISPVDVPFFIDHNHVSVSPDLPVIKYIYSHTHQL